jgi:hypothetical protein
LAQVGEYLGNKYGIYNPNATWMSAYTSEQQAEIALHQWNETQANNYVTLESSNPTMLTHGLTLWLRADAGVTTTNSGSSTNVTTLADQTGNYTLSQTATTNQPTYVASDLNGKPGLRFSGNQWLYSPGNFGTGLNQDMTIITVGMTTSPSTLAYALYLGPNNDVAGINRAFAYYTGKELFDTYGDCFGNWAPNANNFVSEAVTINSTLTNVVFYQDGGQSAAATISGVQELSPGITMGAATGGYDGWQGDIVEQLVYDHQLSAAELLQVGVYLANKYNLPYGGIAPTISPNGGSYSGTQTVSITSHQPTGTLCYTLDGTTPTASSPAYTGSISLPSSALVQAAVFSSAGAQLSQVASAQFYVNDTGDTGLPPAPTGLGVTAASASEIDLSWSLASLLTYSQVYVYRSTNGGAYELIAVLGPAITTYADTNVTAGNSYTYEVGTMNQAGVSDTSASSSVSPTAATAWTVQLTTPSGATPYVP